MAVTSSLYPDGLLNFEKGKVSGVSWFGFVTTKHVERFQLEIPKATTLEIGGSFMVIILIVLILIMNTNNYNKCKGGFGEAISGFPSSRDMVSK